MWLRYCMKVQTQQSGVVSAAVHWIVVLTSPGVYKLRRRHIFDSNSGVDAEYCVYIGFYTLYKKQNPVLKPLKDLTIFSQFKPVVSVNNGSSSLIVLQAPLFFLFFF